MTILDREGLEHVDDLPKEKDRVIVCRTHSIHNSSMLQSVLAPKTGQPITANYEQYL